MRPAATTYKIELSQRKANEEPSGTIQTPIPDDGYRYNVSIGPWVPDVFKPDVEKMGLPTTTTLSKVAENLLCRFDKDEKSELVECDSPYNLQTKFKITASEDHQLNPFEGTKVTRYYNRAVIQSPRIKELLKAQKYFAYSVDFMQFQKLTPKQWTELVNEPGKVLLQSKSFSENVWKAIKEGEVDSLVYDFYGTAGNLCYRVDDKKG
jgi:hypothetical protein